MTVESLERVMWRLRKNGFGGVFFNDSLRRAIMYEIGTDIRTHKANRLALIKLGWIKPHGKHQFKLTNKDLD